MEPLYNTPLREAANTPSLEVAVNNIGKQKPFIEANTIEATLEEIRRHHIIPVFHRDNEPVISQVEFIEATMDAVHGHFPSERILQPQIRLSHPIMGRVPDAKDKPAKELQEAEKTIYYERMAFVVEVASITDTIDGQRLSLTIGGVKAHNLDNLYAKRGGEEHFKLFIGFKVQVCTNLCVWSDGLAGDVKVWSLSQLKSAIKSLVSEYDAVSSLARMSELQQYILAENQFAHLIGRCRMYSFLSAGQKREIPELLFGDQQIGAVCRDYYKDHSFCKGEDGSINLWRLYNLFTAANKSSYIDAFLSRSVSASELVTSLADALKDGKVNWFLQ
ncbi:DUF3871 family protein [Paracnuella aquatica]|uniref:DUF3871 family protein n=1 Tax=Paracnuella aquatica TaxID=2268757 RepID=UPI000DEF410C|nr:DUF3871 family protein [Paracnuella aquatica]RPD50645.1 DUF3871 family protein [Paracnuella aquatica]